MTNKQINILKSYGYEVIPSINYLRYKNSDYPIAYIEYNNKINRFTLSLLKTSFYSKEDIYNAEKQITDALNIIKIINDI